MDVSRLQERGDAVQARLAIDELVVVSGPIELLERNAMLLRPLAQEVVEHLLPRLRVDLRRLRQHAVEIEQTRRDLLWQVEHAPTVPERHAMKGETSAAGRDRVQNAARSFGASCFLRLMTPGSSMAPPRVRVSKARSTRASSPHTSRVVPLARMSVSINAKLT